MPRLAGLFYSFLLILSGFFMQSDIQKVWYKQFWPWFLIVLPLTSMVLSFSMLNLAFNSEDSMVIDDYYKEGRGINLKIQKLQQAKILNIATKMQVFADYVEVTFISGAPDNGQALTLDFFHSTQKFKDFRNRYSKWSLCCEFFLLFSKLKNFHDRYKEKFSFFL